MNSIPTVGVLICKEGKALLVKHGEGASHETGVYGWPGGRIDPGETFKQAAVRELREETGLIAKEEDLEESVVPVEPVAIKRKNGEIHHFSAVLFVCNHFSGELRSTAETIPEWIPLTHFDQLSLLPNVKKVFSNLF